MNANDMQVGGDHYKADYQHWDWGTDIGLSGLEWTATKYLTRWRDKAGLQDLRKPRHFIVKLIECYDQGRRDPNGFAATINEEFYTDKFFKANPQITPQEQHIICKIIRWRNERDLYAVLDLLDDYYGAARAGNVPGWPKGAGAAPQATSGQHGQPDTSHKQARSAAMGRVFAEEYGYRGADGNAAQDADHTGMEPWNDG